MANPRKPIAIEPDALATLSPAVFDRAAEVAADETPIQKDNELEQWNLITNLDLADENITYDIRVYKVSEDAKEWQYLFNLEPAQVASVWQQCSREYGSGQYSVRVYQQVGRQKRLFAQTKQRILARPQPATPEQRPSDLSAILAAMEANNTRMTAFMERLATRPQEPAPNALAGITDMAKAIGAIMAVMPQQQQRSESGGEMKGFIQALSLVKELGMGGGGGDIAEGGPSLWGMAEKLLDKLPAIAAIAQTRPPVAVPPARPPASVRPSIPQHSSPPKVKAQAIEPRPEVMQSLFAQIPFLVSRAKAGNKPETYAELLLDTYGANTVAWLATRKDLFPALAQQMPEVATYSVWFGKLIDGILNLVQIEGDTATKVNGAPDAIGQVPPSDHNSNPTGESGRSGYAQPDVGASEEWA